MKTREGIFSLAVVLALGGCNGDVAEQPGAPAGAPVVTRKAPEPTPSPSPARPADEKKPADAKPAPAPAPAPAKADAKPADAGKGDLPPLEEPKSGATDSDHVTLTAAEIANVKLLPEAEQAGALKQAVCPVSGDHLGSMDKPVKLTLDGRDVYLCCDGCGPKAKKDPAAIFAKLDKK